MAALLGVIAAAVAVTLAGPGGRSSERSRPGPPAGRPATNAHSAQSTVPSAPLQDVLDRYGRAVVHHDRRLLLSTLDPHAGRFRAAALRWLADTRAVPFAGWRVTLGPRDLLTAVHGSQVTAGQSLLKYRLAGFDTRPVTQPLDPVFTRRNGQWTLAALTAIRADGLPRPTELWDLEPVRVVRTGRVLVLGGPADLAAMRELAALAAVAIPDVTAVWGNGWPQRAVVEMPASQRQFGRISGFHGPLSAVAAVTNAEIHSFGPADPAGDRIAVNPSTWSRLSAVGRQIVITHEVTHLASRASTGARTPKWISEGFAEWVSFRGSGVPVATAAVALQRQVAAGRLPQQLPADGAFTGSPARLSLAYDEAWLACMTIADHWGQAALVRFYRAVGTSTHPPGAAVSSALHRILHASRSGLLRQWHRRLVTELG